MTGFCQNITTMSEKTEVAVFSAGCFWGVQYLFDKLDGVLETKVGYTGGDTENPSYDQVKTGTTGHFEAVWIKYDPAKISYEDLVKFFFEIHDFTQRDGQGPDIGPQYLSNIFYLNEEQYQIAFEYIEKLIKMGYDVATGLIRFEKFWDAEEYHQKFYEKTGGTPYCHIHRPIKWK